MRWILTQSQYVALVDALRSGDSDTLRARIAALDDGAMQRYASYHAETHDDTLIAALLEHGRRPTAHMEVYARRGDLEAVRRLCPDGFYDVKGVALRAAAWRGHSDVLRELMRVAAEPYDVAHLNVALRAAARRGHVAVVRELVRATPAARPCDVDNLLVLCITGAARRFAATAATEEADASAAALVSELLWGPHAAPADDMHSYALYVAAKRGFVETARRLMDAPVHAARCEAALVAHDMPDATLKHTLVEALSRARPRRVVQPMYTREPTGPGYLAEALTKAAADADRESVRVLLMKGADVQSTTAPLLAAVRAGHVDVVSLLIDAGADCRDALDMTLDQAMARQLLAAAAGVQVTENAAPERDAPAPLAVADWDVYEHDDEAEQDEDDERVGSTIVLGRHPDEVDLLDAEVIVCRGPRLRLQLDYKIDDDVACVELWLRSGNGKYITLADVVKHVLTIYYAYGDEHDAVMHTLAYDSTRDVYRIDCDS